MRGDYHPNLSLDRKRPDNRMTPATSDLTRMRETVGDGNEGPLIMDNGLTEENLYRP